MGRLKELRKYVDSELNKICERGCPAGAGMIPFLHGMYVGNYSLNASLTNSISFFI